ncbi:hypothetical protein GQX73_g286 [Xylaria multiplex]|uniref:Uncharacterized protein n=1 Tax=Xylaria multiplex TaxID=323545 RepID=A0A7C8IZT1_9PEZI|nr:hypothetical protein GQX73_g286 [Xylaria multiplex]
MVMNLVACGVPANTYDEFGETPGIALLLGGPNETGLVVDLAKRLLPEPDIPLVSERALYRKDIKHLKLILEDSVIAEASGCGPLSLAARAGDERLVRELIKKYPQSLKEVNDFEDTPLHLAIKHPSCLRLILEAGGSLMLEQLEAEAWDWTPLACACRLGCRASAQILLATGSRINEFCIIHGHESCLDDVLAALKQRRDEIKLLALEHLTQAEAKGFGLHEEKVLDGCALEVQRLLLERGVHVPPRLCDGLYYPVYFLAYSTPLFDKLWALGFRDVNSCNKFGDMPLTRYRFDVEKARWLIEHGADYWTPFYERSSSTDISNITATPAHFLCCRVGLPYQLYGEHSDEYYKRVKTSQWLVEKLIQVQVTDACSCPCFGGGCTPLKGFFDQLRDYRNLTNIQDLARWCVGLTRTFLASFGEEDLITALRRMTFDGLGLTHTCCNLWNDIQRYHESFYTLEEVEEINSEQRPLLTLFNNLLVEFDQVAHEDQDGLPLIVHDPEEFWVHRWLPRMEETLDGLNGDDITAEERSAAEAVGVKWDLQPLKEVEEEEEEDWTPEYVMERLKKILDE